MRHKTTIIFFIFHVFLTSATLAEQSNDAEKVSVAIEEYSNLIDVAVSDEPVYDYELNESKDKLLRILHDENDKNKVVDIISHLLDSIHKYKEVDRLGKPVIFTNTYGCDFLAKLGTQHAFNRLLDEYEFWDNQQIKYSMYTLIRREAKKDLETFDSKRFSELQCGNTDDPHACAKIEGSKKQLKESGKPGKVIILNGGAKICC